MVRFETQQDTIPRPMAQDAPIEHQLVDLAIDTQHGGETLPTLETSPPFVLAYHPARMTVFDTPSGRRVAPVLKLLRLQNGLNGVSVEVRTDREGRKSVQYRWRTMAARMAERGWTIIDSRHGPDGRSYLQRVPVRGGYAHLDVWQTALAGQRYTRTDVEGYLDWLNTLIADGIVPKPSIDALRVLAERRRADHVRLASTNSDRASRRVLAESMLRDAEAIEAYIAELEGADHVSVAGEAVEPPADETPKTPTKKPATSRKRSSTSSKE